MPGIGQQPFESASQIDVGFDMYASLAEKDMVDLVPNLWWKIKEVDFGYRSCHLELLPGLPTVSREWSLRFLLSKFELKGGEVDEEEEEVNAVTGRKSCETFSVR